MRSEGPELPAAEGGATEEPKAVRVGAAPVDEVENSPASPRRCWMECSWKQGSARRTEAARDVLETEEERKERKSHWV